MLILPPNTLYFFTNVKEKQRGVPFKKREQKEHDHFDHAQLFFLTH